MNQLTRPGKWRYDASPLEAFDWSEGCVRFEFVVVDDGEEDEKIREGFYMTIGVISTLDCKDESDLKKAQEKISHLEKKRIVVFDSFAEESSGIDVDASRVVNLNELIAFPPLQVMDMHLNVVVNDLAVTIFIDLEERIRQNDILVKTPSLIKIKKGEFLLALLGVEDRDQIQSMSAKNKIDFIRKREVARREKQSADFCLLLGSPCDAYRRYNRASELTMASSPDPLWYALSLEGCIASLVAMADAGGHGADEFLETSFQVILFFPLFLKVLVC